MLTLYVKSGFMNSIYIQQLRTFIHTIPYSILYNTYNYTIQFWCPLKTQYKKVNQIIVIIMIKYDHAWCVMLVSKNLLYTIIQTKCNSCRQRDFRKGSESDKINKESSTEFPFSFGFSGKHLASICSVSCSEFLITVTVSMSNQTHKSGKVSMPRFHYELNTVDQNVKCMNSKKQVSPCGCSGFPFQEAFNS